MGERVLLLQLWARLLAVFSAFVLSATALAAHASGLEPLSPDDVRYYRAAFTATDRGDFDSAEAAFANTRDRSLAGRLVFAKIMHPTRYSASYAELTRWLDSHGEEAGADRVYSLALKRKPNSKRAAAPPVPTLFVADESGPRQRTRVAPRGRPTTPAM